VAFVLKLNPQIMKAATGLANGDVRKMTVAIEPADQSSEATTLVSQIRDLSPPDGLTTLVTGVAPRDIDTVAGIEETLPEAFLVIIGSIFLIPDR
jgi:putative drug exporter of the RND superfamily